MKVNGTLVNYWFHCKRQCYLFGNRLNLEDNSENVKIGRAIHEIKAEGRENSELTVDNIKLDKLTKDYLVEVKKSDADMEAGKWQLLFYLKRLKEKGVERKGKLQCVEKNKAESKTVYVELDEETEQELDMVISEIEKLLAGEKIPPVAKNKSSCKNCAYFEYCYI